jgi:hypothetical protein
MRSFLLRAVSVFAVAVRADATSVSLPKDLEVRAGASDACPMRACRQYLQLCLSDQEFALGGLCRRSQPCCCSGFKLVRCPLRRRPHGELIQSASPHTRETPQTRSVTALNGERQTQTTRTGPANRACHARSGSGAFAKPAPSSTRRSMRRSLALLNRSKAARESTQRGPATGVRHSKGHKRNGGSFGTMSVLRSPHPSGVSRWTATKLSCSARCAPGLRVSMILLVDTRPSELFRQPKKCGLPPTGSWHTPTTRADRDCRDGFAALRGTRPEHHRDLRRIHRRSHRPRSCAQPRRAWDRALDRAGSKTSGDLIGILRSGA